MKKYILLFAICFSVHSVYSQNDLMLKSKTDTAVITLIDSTFLLKIDGKEYIKIPKNKTIYLMDNAGAWDDLRVPVTATTASGSNPPEFSAFKNSGGEYIGTALYFDGVNDFDSIPANKLLNFQQSSFTVAFWMKNDADIQNDAKIIYKKNGWNIAYIHDKIRVYLEGKQVYLSTVDLNDGARNFVVVSVMSGTSSTSLNIYVNGKQAGSQTFSTAVTDVTSPVFIGKADAKGFGKNFKGVLDDLCIWNKVLSAEERDSLWNSSKGTAIDIAKKNLVLKYTFDDKNSNSVTDYGSNGISAFSAGNTTVPGNVTGLISKTIISHGVFMYYFQKDINEELFFTAQLPHTWIEESDIEPHVHYIRNSSDTGTVVWGIEYTWVNMGENFSDTKTVYTFDTKEADADQHKYSSFGTIEGKGKKISSMLICRIFRDAENPKDTYNHAVGLLEIDFHIRNNSLGSSGMVK